MDGLGGYALRIISGALICGIILSLVKEQTAQGVMKLLCGAVLTMLVVWPLSDVDLSRLPELLPEGLDGRAYIAEGENMARETMAQLIKAETEAYILDKANSLHAALQVEVSVSGDSPPVPVEAALTGKVSPYARSEMERILQKELGIPKENIQWTG